MCGGSRAGCRGWDRRRQWRSPPASCCRRECLPAFGGARAATPSTTRWGCGAPVRLQGCEAAATTHLTLLVGPEVRWRAGVGRGRAGRGRAGRGPRPACSHRHSPQAQLHWLAARRSLPPRAATWFEPRTVSTPCKGLNQSGPFRQAAPQFDSGGVAQEGCEPAGGGRDHTRPPEQPRHL